MFGPFAFVVALLPSVDSADQKRAIERGSSDRYRKCPFCAEAILKEASRCKHCQSTVEPIVSPIQNAVTVRTTPKTPEEIAAEKRRDLLTYLIVGAALAAFAAIVLLSDKAK
jgi:hypothetical protein